MVLEGSFSVYEDVALFRGDCDCPGFLGSREILGVSMLSVREG